jgi:Zn-dependent protease with chaperone function
MGSCAVDVSQRQKLDVYILKKTSLHGDNQMKRLLQCFALTLSLLIFVTTTPVAQKKLKELKLVGYITEFYSPSSFEIEDYRINRDESVILEFENQNPEVVFKPSDLRIGTLVEIRGLYDETTSELKATKVKVDLEQFRQLDVTTILARQPLELTKTETGWTGLIAADGRRIRIGADTKMQFSPNKNERKRQKADDKIAQEKKRRVENPDNDDWTSMKKASGDDSWIEGTASKPAKEEFVPLKTLADVGPGTVMTYHGREQAEGSVLATSVEFKRNEMEESEFKLWKQIKIKEKSFNSESGKPAELKVGPDKYKVLPRQAVQDHVNRLGWSLVPDYQRILPDSNPQKIHFQFRVVQAKSFNAGTYPMGMIVIHSDVFKVLENEAQLAAVLAHEIAHATQEHTYRQMQHNKKRRTALMIGSLVAAGMGYYSISKILDTVKTAMVQGYGRTLENQSDRLALQYMVDAGYDVREAPRVWKLVAKTEGDGPTFYWSSHDSAAERRSFMMITIRNSFSGLDLSRMVKNEGSFQRVAQLVKEADGRKKGKIKVVS